MAGVPSIMRGMLEDVGHRIEGGAVLRSRTVRGKGIGESQIAKELQQLEAEAAGEVAFGSYPWFTPEGFGVHLVARSADLAALDKAAADLMALIRARGAEPEDVSEAS
jgi:molybdopterin-biosynthesis enzyme MoeA-like protein